MKGVQPVFGNQRLHAFCILFFLKKQYIISVVQVLRSKAKHVVIFHQPTTCASNLLLVRRLPTALR